MTEFAQPVIRAADLRDEADWRRLFTLYRAFYRLAPDDAVVDRVWSWITDPRHETAALVAELDGDVVGIADYRVFARPSTGTTGLWLDDLYTDATHRGRGIGRALITHLRHVAYEQGHSVVRWITADDNHQAQALYDTLATRTRWVTFDALPDSSR